MHKKTLQVLGKKTSREGAKELHKPEGAQRQTPLPGINQKNVLTMLNEPIRELGLLKQFPMQSICDRITKAEEIKVNLALYPGYLS